MTLGELKQVVSKLERDGIPNSAKVFMENTQPNCPAAANGCDCDDVDCNVCDVQEDIIEKAAETGTVTFSNSDPAYNTNVVDLNGEVLHNNAVNEMYMSDQMKDLALNARVINRKIAGLMGDFAEAASYELLEHVTQIVMNATEVAKREATADAIEMCHIVKKG